MQPNPVPGWVRRVAGWAPDRLAVRTHDGRRLSYGELDVRSDRLVNALHAHGLRPGDAVGLWMDDQVCNLELYLAAAKAGYVLVPVNQRFTPPEARYLFTESRARAVLYCDSVAARLDTVAGTGALDGALLLVAGRELVAGASRYDDVVAAGSPRLDLPPPGADAPYLVAFSSGTTGYPKGAVLSGRAIGHIATMSALARRLTFYGTGVITTSVSFAASIMANVLTLLSMGGSMVLMGRDWDQDELLSLVEAEHANYLTLASPHFAPFAEAALRRPGTLAAVRSVVHGGSKVPREAMAGLHAAVGDRIAEVWGMVEHSGGPITTTVPEDYHPGAGADDVLESVGRPLPQVELELRGPDGAVLPHDGTAVGELVVRSPALMDGYLGRPADTAAALRAGWYHTGDLGRIDQAGYVYIVDRRGDLIVSGGMNIYPGEIERVLESCPGVAEAVVVGLPHPRWGRSPGAAVVRDPGARLDADQLLAYLAERLAGYKKPTRLRFVDELPRNVSGKVVRRAVEDLLAD
jgi:acyl-CoA synthetase (AMP-forming)/AMP-acid ligase II